MKKSALLGCLGIVVASGLAAGVVACSAGADPGETTAAESAPIRALVSPGDTLYADPPSSFGAQCEVGGDLADPTLVLRIPDGDGAKYSPYYSDDYSVEFPTPWVAPTGGTCPLALGSNGTLSAHCTIAPDVYAFEHAVAANVAGIVAHQFLVYDLKYDGAKTYTVGDRQWFYNGTQNPNALGTMQAIVASFANAGIVAPAVKECVYVVDLSGQSIVGTEYHAVVAQSHDPINWPNLH